MQRNKLLSLIKKFSQQKILVIGDLMLDKYLWCEIERISPEAPVPVALVKNENYALGGAANVANNLASLGASVDLVGIIGNGFDGEFICQKLKEKNISFSGSIIDKKRVTTVKKRIMCGTHQSLRIDYEDSKSINTEEEKEIISYVKKQLPLIKVLIFADYGKGLISHKLARSIISFANKKNVKVLVDPTANTFDRFKNAYLVKPNKKEAECFAKEKIEENYSNLRKVGLKIKKKLRTNLIITLGKDGMIFFNGNKVLLIPTVAKEVFDVSGAGDTVISALALSLSSGANLEEAMVLSNYCAGIVVSKLGTAACTKDELYQRVENNKKKS